MGVERAAVWRRFSGMAVDVNMHGAIAMVMLVEMNAVAPQTPQHVGAETDQHDADGRLDRARQGFGNGPAKHKRGACKREQCQRMPDPPGETVFDDVGNVAAPCGDAGNRSDVIGLKRMPHAQKKTKSQNSKHR